MATIPFEDPNRPQDGDGEKLLDTAWSDFNLLYRDEPVCVEATAVCLKEAGQGNCKKCFGDKIVREYGARIGICQDCQAEFRLTAGTFFHGVRKLRPWVAAIWLTERGIAINSMQMHELLKVAQSTGWDTLTRVKMVLAYHISTIKAAVELNLGIFCAAVSKRSRETPAHQHPAAEQAELEKKAQAEGLLDNQPAQPASVSGAGNVSTDELDDNLVLVYQCFSDEPESFETLLGKTGLSTGLLGARLSMLELGGWIEKLPGEKYVPVAPYGTNGKLASSSGKGGRHALHPTEKLNIIGTFRFNFRGISRKYLQLYLAWYWCMHDRKRWEPGALLDACCRFPEIEHRKIRAYVSPLFGKIVTRRQAA